MKYCPECAYPNDWSDHRCEKCGVRFAEDVPAAIPARSGARAVDSPARATRGRTTRRAQRDLQGSLDFGIPPSAPSTPMRGKVIRFPSRDAISVGGGAAAAPATSSARPSDSPARARVTRPAAPTNDQQPTIPFPAPPALGTPAPLLPFPVAPMAARCIAAAVDGVWVAIGCALLFGPYYMIGGRMPLGPQLSGPQLRTSLAPFLAAGAVLALAYLYLFLTFAKATPGMDCLGLGVVDFDGRLATRRQRQRRVLASVASAASLLLGFVLAFMDEERLTWHDRMSETCLTLKQHRKSNRK